MRDTTRRPGAVRDGMGPRGFTLVEVLIAIVLINAGLLALVAGSAVLIRQTTEARTRAAAVRVAANRLETLGAGGCAAVSGETVSISGLDERWSSISQPNFAHELRDSVVFVVQGAAKAIVLSTRLPC